MQAKCPHCGANNLPGKILCATCGKALMQPKSKPAPQLAQTFPPTQASTPSASVGPTNLQNQGQPVVTTSVTPATTRSGVSIPTSQQTAIYQTPAVTGGGPNPSNVVSNIPPPNTAGRAVNPPIPNVPTSTAANTLGGTTTLRQFSGLSVGKSTWYSGIAGGLGGLIPQLMLSQYDAISVPLVSDFLVFCGAGLLIGAALGAVDGVMAKHTKLAWHDARRGAIVGTVGGLITLVIAEIIFHFLGATEFARNVGWIVFGAPFGAIQGLRRKSSSQGLLGMVGGASGGLVGGFLANLSIPFGLAIMGFLIGFLSGLLHDLFKRAWIRVISGRSEGREVALDKQDTVLGSGDLGQVDFGLYGDAGILQRHVQIQKRGNSYYVAPIGAAPVLVNGATVSQPRILSDHDKISVGSTLLLFQTRSAN